MSDLRKVFMLLLFVFSANVIVAQEPKWKELQKESDGFRWYKYTYEKNSNGKYPSAAFDRNGKRLTCTTEHFVHYMHGFFEVWTRNDENGNHVSAIYDKQGNCIIPDEFGFSSISIYPEYKLIHCSNSMVLDGKYLFTMDGKYYADANVVYWTKKGEFKKAEKLPVSHLTNQCLASDSGPQQEEINDSGEQETSKVLQEEEDGYKWYLVSENDLEGAQNMKGKTIIPTKFDIIAYAKDDLFWVQLNDKVGAYDAKGHELLPAQYDDIHIREQGGQTLFYVFLNDKIGVSDMKGKTIITPKYDEITCSEYDFFWIECDGKYGICDKKGNEIVAPAYKNITYYTDRSFSYESESGDMVAMNLSIDNNGTFHHNDDYQAPAKKKPKKSFGEVMGIIADGLQGVSEALEGFNEALQPLAEQNNNYYNPQNNYNSSFGNNYNYSNNDDDYKQRREERDKKADQMEWDRKHGSTYINTYRKWYETIQDVKRKSIVVKNWEPEYRLKRLKEAQSKCKEIAKKYKEMTGREIPCPTDDLNWVPSSRDLVG